MAEKALALLCSSAKIERDKGVLELKSFQLKADDKEYKCLSDSIGKLLSDDDSPWETKHGALMGTQALLTFQQKPCCDEFVASLLESSMQLLRNNESRVRLAAGDVIKELCRRNGGCVYEQIKDKVLDGVWSNLERQPLTEADQKEQKQNEQLMDKLITTGEHQATQGTIVDKIFHDTAGWKALETWMKCLQSVIDGCGTSFNAFINQPLLDLIFQTLTHTNRFVRETGYYLCGSLVKCNYEQDGKLKCSHEDNEVYKNGNQFAQQLANGLADNWSQVRLAASTAARNFLLGLPEKSREEFYDLLLPPLCLNRYYVAEGVRIYNQETWRLVTNGQGRNLVESHISHIVRMFDGIIEVKIVDFYMSQSEADNHAVREAACACIAELGSKINKVAVSPFVPKLLGALLVCFKDESWPVRDASCVACGNFIKCFPEESKTTMKELYPLFYSNLQDNIPSVRQGAAVALANVVEAYGSEAEIQVFEKIEEGLKGVEKQPENTEKYSSLDKGPATYGVAKRLRDNDMELHTDLQMYSCGSLAPKMHRGKRGGGCMDHNFRRAPELWELGDGCACLLGELSRISSLAPEIGKKLPLLAKAAGMHHYTQHVQFQETVCKQLPVIAKGMGKKPFKMNLEHFIDPVFSSLGCDTELTAAAAGQCLQDLNAFLGPSIFRGRLEQYNPRYLEEFDKHLQSAKGGSGMGPRFGGPGSCIPAVAHPMCPADMGPMGYQPGLRHADVIGIRPPMLGNGN